jgi:hypothetical protein
MRLIYNTSAKEEEGEYLGVSICRVRDTYSEFIEDDPWYQKWISKFGEGMLTALCNSAEAIDLLEAAADKLLEMEGNPNIGVAPSRIADRVSESLKDGWQVILVGHSQGNLKIARALNLLWENHGNWAASTVAAQSNLPSRVAIAAIGCPADYEQARGRGIRVRKYNIRESESGEDVFKVLKDIAWRYVKEKALDKKIKDDVVALFDTTQPKSEWLANKWNNFYFPTTHSLKEAYVKFYGVEIREGIRGLAEALGGAEADDGGQIPSGGCAALAGKWWMFAPLGEDAWPYMGVVEFDSGGDLVAVSHPDGMSGNTLIADGQQHTAPAEDPEYAYDYTFSGACTESGDGFVISLAAEAWYPSDPEENSFELNFAGSFAADGQAASGGLTGVLVAGGESQSINSTFTFHKADPERVGACAGTYEGTLSGDDSGDIRANVTHDGVITGEIESAWVIISFAGVVTADAAVGGAEGISSEDWITGDFSHETCSMNGTWGEPGYSGNFEVSLSP